MRRYQAPPAPLAGDGDDSDDDDGGAFGRPATRAFGGGYAAAAGGVAGGIGRFLNPGAFQAGFGGHAFARPPASAFRRQYRAYSTAILEVQQGRSYSGGRANLMYGGKSASPSLSSLVVLFCALTCPVSRSRHAPVGSRRAECVVVRIGLVVDRVADPSPSRSATRRRAPDQL